MRNELTQWKILIVITKVWFLRISARYPIKLRTRERESRKRHVSHTNSLYFRNHPFYTHIGYTLGDAGGFIVKWGIIFSICTCQPQFNGSNVWPSQVWIWWYTLRKCCFAESNVGGSCSGLTAFFSANLFHEHLVAQFIQTCDIFFSVIYSKQ